MAALAVQRFNELVEKIEGGCSTFPHAGQDVRALLTGADKEGRTKAGNLVAEARDVIRFLRRKGLDDNEATLVALIGRTWAANPPYTGDELAQNESR